MARPLGALTAAALGVLALAPAVAASRADVAALQIGLRAHGTYAGTVDGLSGPRTELAVRAFQRAAGLAVDGVAGPATRAALGRVPGWSWETAVLQFELARRGFPSGPLDGRMGPRTERALRKFQRSAGLAPDGVVGPATLAALRRPPPAVPIPLAAPVPGPAGERFGPREDQFHTGIDYPAPAGTPVAAAAAGRVTFAGMLGSGWGLTVTVAHGNGLRTMYAHLSRIGVRLGDRVGTGAAIGAVGSTGRSTGPHLHFEARLRGAAVDPLPALGRR